MMMKYRFGVWKRWSAIEKAIRELQQENARLLAVARAASAAWPFIFDDLPTALNAKRKKYKKLGDALEEAGDLL